MFTCIKHDKVRNVKVTKVISAAQIDSIFIKIRLHCPLFFVYFPVITFIRARGFLFFFLYLNQFRGFLPHWLVPEVYFQQIVRFAEKSEV